MYVIAFGHRRMQDSAGKGYDFNFEARVSRPN